MLQEVQPNIIEIPIPGFPRIGSEWLEWKAKKLGIPYKTNTTDELAILFTNVSSAVLKDDLIKHSKLEGWIVHKKLGQGSYGAVYKVTDPTGKVFALKFFPVSIAPDFYPEDFDGSPGGLEASVASLDGIYSKKTLPDYWNVSLGLGEEKALKVIQDSRGSTDLLMQSYAYGVTSFEDGIFAFAVIEFIEGTSLTELIRCARETGWRASQKIFEKFASILFHGVSQLHAIGLAHLDINPNNIMFTGTKLKLVDFGFACIFGKGNKCTWSQSTINPPEFTFDVSRKTMMQAEAIDVWCTAYTILCLLTITDKVEYCQEDREDRAQNKKDIERRLKLAKERYKLPPMFLRALDDTPMKRPRAYEIYREFDRLL
ncbi:putative serine/threonine protein kinase [Insectomime virus]|nr:putative serine/threonine protein kinase [Insectomime virus]